MLDDLPNVLLTKKKNRKKFDDCAKLVPVASKTIIDSHFKIKYCKSGGPLLTITYKYAYVESRKSGFF